MDLTDIFIRVLGAFYTFAGVVGVRAALMSRLLDIAIAGITLKKPSLAETRRSQWLLASTVIVFAGGIALLLGLDAALPLFLLSALGQALYIFWIAPRYLDKDDPPEGQGRQQTTNAFIVYLIATALVAWAGSAGRLIPTHDAPWPVLAIAGAALALLVTYIFRAVQPTTPTETDAHLVDIAAASGADERPDPSVSRRIKVMAEPGRHPLWALDPGLDGDFSPYALELTYELASELEIWGDADTMRDDTDTPERSTWSQSEIEEHQAQGRHLAAWLAREMPDRTIYVMDPRLGVVEVPPGEEPKA